MMPKKSTLPTTHLHFHNLCSFQLSVGNLFPFASGLLPGKVLPTLSTGAENPAVWMMKSFGHHCRQNLPFPEFCEKP
jgi:hypothetical protein